MIVMKISIEKNIDMNNLLNYILCKKWDLNAKEFKKIKIINQKLDRYFSKQGKMISVEIQKITGFEWHEDEIKVYVILERLMRGPSGISYPLMVKYSNDFEMVLAFILHEIIHHNLNCNEFSNLSSEKTYEKEGGVKFGIEDVVNVILIELLKRLHKNKSNIIIKKFRDYLTSMYAKTSWEGVKILEKKWNFNKTSLSKLMI
jgi:hypothetical protein